ncbi:MAG: citryl-CoA lyase [Acidobacteria bacterium]|nr:citryl-CoA lyase [Acidobacteriota bacterium]
MSEEKRKTAISWVETEGILVRGYRMEELIGRISWAEAVYLILKGELPPKPISRMLEAILVSVIDHGVGPPSTVSAVTAANTGASVSAAVAAGLLAINSRHGGAVEDCMGVLQDCVCTQDRDGIGAAEAAERAIAEHRARQRRIPGYGHRVHRVDPRTARLFELSEELKIAGKYVHQAREMERALLSLTGKPLPINADGAIAALLCELDFPKEVANGIFMIARVPGLVAHVSEEHARGRPMRTVDPNAYEYDGPPPRRLTKVDEKETDEE